MAKNNEEQNPVQVFARGFNGVLFLDAQFDDAAVAVMSAATFAELQKQFGGADIQILEAEDK